MTCKQFAERLSLWLEGELTPAEARQMLLHAEACVGCAGLRETVARLLEEAPAATDSPLPPSAARCWRNAVRREEEIPQKPPRRHSPPWLRYGAVAAAVLLLVGLASLGGGGNIAGEPQLTAADFRLDAPAAGEMDVGGLALSEAPVPEESGAVLYAADDADIDPSRPRDTLLQRSAWASLRTRQFDTDAEKLLLLPAQLEGWIERQSLSGQPYEQEGEGRSLSLTLRVPVERLEEAMGYLDVIGTLESSGAYAEDISDRYYDAQGRLDSALALRGQLLALLEKTEDVDSLTTLTKELSDNQLTIDTLQGSLRGMEGRVNYSELSITLAEQRPAGIAAPAGGGLGERIASGFVDSINAGLSFLANLLVWLVRLLPWALAAGLLIWLILWLVRRRRK